MTYKAVIDAERNISKLTIASEQELTNTFQPLGNPIKVMGFINIALWLKGLLNDSDEVVFRCKCYPSLDSVNTSDYYYTQIQTIDSSTVSLTLEEYKINQATIELVVPLGISQLAPYIQIEAKVTTAGATPAKIDRSLLTFERENF
jgi:hypothetical protein